MSIISFSIDEETKQELDQLARDERRSKSDIFREMYRAYTFDRTLTKLQRVGKEKFLALGIESIDDAEAFLG
jgi:predicted transcriptional regulator